MLPGRALHRLAGRICNAQTLERVVEPAIADLQKEFAAAGHHGQRVGILLLGYGAIAKVITVCVFSMSRVSDAEHRLLSTTFAWSCAMVACMSGLLIFPPIVGLSPVLRGWYAVLTLAPQAVPIAIPTGLALGVAFGFSARSTVNAAKLLLLGALSASLLSFVVLAWAMPAGNRAFTEFSFSEHELSGFEGHRDNRLQSDSEMTLPELRAESVRWFAQGEPHLARQFAFRFHRRFALALAALALVAALLAWPIDYRAARGLLAVAVCLGYWILMHAGESAYQKGFAPPLLAAWLPNLAMLAFAVFIASSRSSRLRVPKAAAS